MLVKNAYRLRGGARLLALVRLCRSLVFTPLALHAVRRRYMRSVGRGPSAFGHLTQLCAEIFNFILMVSNAFLDVCKV